MGIYAYLPRHHFRIPHTTSWINISRTSPIFPFLPVLHDTHFVNMGVGFNRV